MLSAALIILFFLLMLIMSYAVKRIFYIEKERNLKRKELIKDFKIRMFYCFLYDSCVVVLVLTVFSRSMNISFNRYNFLLFGLIGVVYIVSFAFGRIIFRKSYLTKQGISIAGEFLFWREVSVLENNKFFLKIKTKRKFHKTRWVNKIFYEISEEDVNQLVDMWKAQSGISDSLK